VNDITATQVLVRDHQRRLEDAARRHRQQRELPLASRARLRTEAGWLLVRTGLRLAHIDPWRRAPALFGPN
jgi:hypothetical protein